MGEEKIKIAMMTAASKALDYKKINTKADPDEVIQYIMEELKVKGQAKIGAVAAASKALEYKEKDPEAKDKEILQKVMNDIKDMLMTIDMA